MATASCSANCSANTTTSVPVTYTIGGVRVVFPVKAYPSQISMMDKIIRGCHRAQNCLLESPTGSGKTLALLCGAIAWQRAEATKLHDEYNTKKIEYDRCLEKLQKLNAKVQPQERKVDVVEVVEVNSNNELRTISAEKTAENDDSVDEVNLFRPCKKMKIIWNASDLREAGDNPQEARQKNESVSKDSMMDTHSDEMTPSESDQPAIINDAMSSKPAESKPIAADTLRMPPPPKPPKIPKIYFGTRTHKQIAQVVKELRKTAYNDVRTTILSSRNHSCINDGNYLARKNRATTVDKNELCSELLDARKGPGCKYYQKQKNSHMTEKITPETEPSMVWDIEDLVNYGKQKSICPYFAARDLMLPAHVIFCPYNYLTDPMIRASLNISLHGDVIIVDEAHNIEDTCRESASFSVDENDLLDAANDCDEKAKNSMIGDTLKNLSQSLRSVALYISHNKDRVPSDDFNSGVLTMYGKHAVDTFKGYEFDKMHFAGLKTLFAQYSQAIAEQSNDETKEWDTEPLKPATKTRIQNLLFVLETLYNEKYTKDYQIAISKSFTNRSSEAQETDQFGFHNMRDKEKVTMRWKYTLNFWCLNPAAVFDDIRNEVRCIILTSGTLSPLESFQSELGATFPITLEANHVIDASQCWIGSLGIGPNNICLEGKYTNTSTYPFQDEIGEIVLGLCKVTPHGILCFVSSYHLLEKLQNRWEATGLSNKIRRHKDIIYEPRRGDQLQDVMRHFYNTIQETKMVEAGKGKTGALLMAVCRGKISEGLDFADENARAVITIGIPYPNMKDSQVKLKKSYNDENRHTKNLLTGSDWYQIQAYRALNQALGRCLRHRGDWGAILLIDSRFSHEYYRKGLSKWLRSKLQHHFSYNQMIYDFSGFMEGRLRKEKELEK